MQLDRLKQTQFMAFQIGLITLSFLKLLKVPERGWPQKWDWPFSFLYGRCHSGSIQKSKAHTVGTLKGATWARSRAWERWQAGQNDSLSTFVSVLTIA